MNFIAEKRREKGLTQGQVAEATGIPLRTFVRIENAMKHDMDGVDSVKTGNLRRIAAYFECSLDDLVPSGNPPEASGERKGSTSEFIS